MGGDWYYPFTLYGYSVPADVCEIGAKLRRVRKCLSASDPTNTFQVTLLLKEFHSRMEGRCSEEMLDMAIIVLGFRPSSDMLVNQIAAEKLKALVATEAFSTLSLGSPRFYAGIDWDEPYNDDDDDDDE